MSHAQHQAASANVRVRCAVVTLSDSRTTDTDDSGKLIQRLLAAAGIPAEPTVLLPDDPAALRATLDDLLGRPEIDAVLTNGGTGIARRDQTVAVIDAMLDVPLPGFGELFRMLSWDQIGAGAMLSRASAGRGPRETGLLHARVAERGRTGDDEADPAGVETSGARNAAVASGPPCTCGVAASLLAGCPVNPRDQARGYAADDDL